jgi:transposase
VDQRVRRSRYDYTLNFKLTVVERVERGDLTAREAQLHYGIQGSGTVRRWLREHGRWGRNPASLDVVERETAVAKSSSQLTPEQQRIKQLEAELREAREKANFFEAVVDVLRKDYGIVPVKKPSGKSSQKSSSKGST